MNINVFITSFLCDVCMKQSTEQRRANCSTIEETEESSNSLSAERTAAPKAQHNESLPTGWPDSRRLYTGGMQVFYDVYGRA